MHSANLQIYPPGEDFRAGERRYEAMALPVEKQGGRRRPDPGNRDYIRKCGFDKELAGPGRKVTLSLFAELKENPF